MGVQKGLLGFLGGVEFATTSFSVASSLCLAFLAFQEGRQLLLSGIACLNKLSGVEVLSFGNLA